MEASVHEHQPSEGHDLVVVGASAGGVEALSALVSALPRDLAATVCVVLHLPAGGTSVLADILGRAGALPATTAVDGRPLARACIIVAPPDSHLTIVDGCAQLTHGPRENGHRPAIDTLFRSAAEARGRQTVGVILSGTLDDGALGLREIKRAGGVAIVQDPETARYAGMPRNAISVADPDLVLPLAAISAALVELADDPVDPAQEVTMAHVDNGREQFETEVEQGSAQHAQPGELVPVMCPECGGSLWQEELRNGAVAFRCRVGHAFGPQSLAAEQGRTLETALWSSLRLLEERVSLSERLAERFGSATRSSQWFAGQALELKQHAVALRQMLDGLDATPPEEATGE
jgi:two-component system chemotaxis response regulator CheB